MKNLFILFLQKSILRATLLSAIMILTTLLLDAQPPTDHGTLGTLDNSEGLTSTSTGTYLPISFDPIVDGGCGTVDIEIFFTLTWNDNGPRSTIISVYNSSVVSPTLEAWETIWGAAVAQAGWNGEYTITNVSGYFYIGTGGPYSIYPTGNKQCFKTSYQNAPCDCICVTWTQSPRHVAISTGSYTHECD